MARRTARDSLTPTSRGFFVAVYASGRDRLRRPVPGERHPPRAAPRRLASVTPEDARKRALAVLGGAADGKDAAEEKRAAREAATKRKEADHVQGLARGVHARGRPVAQEDARSRALPRDGGRGVGLRARWKRSRRGTSRRSGTGSRSAGRRKRTDGPACSAPVSRRPSGSATSDRTSSRSSSIFARIAPRTRTLTPDEEKRMRAAIAAWPNPFEKAALTLLDRHGRTALRGPQGEVVGLRPRREDARGDVAHSVAEGGEAASVPILPHVGKPSSRRRPGSTMRRSSSSGASGRLRATTSGSRGRR